MLKRLGKLLLAVGFLSTLSVSGFAAAETPTTTRTELVGSARLIIYNFSGGTADDGDTFASGLTKTPPVAYWTQDTDNPTTQASVGVAVTYSAGTFTFYPAEDNKSFYLFVLVRS